MHEMGLMDAVLRMVDRIRREQAIPALFDAVAQMLPESGNIRMLPVLFLAKDGLRIGLKIGEERLYVVRHIPHFLQAILHECLAQQYVHHQLQLSYLHP